MKLTALAIAAIGLVLTGSICEAGHQHESAAGDIAAGKSVAAACAACHGMDGMGRTPLTPHLAGQHGIFLVHELTAYKTGERDSKDMHDTVARLSEKDILNVAAYFASLKPFKNAVAGARNAVAKEADPFAAVKEASAACAGCHGENGNSDMPGMPSLAGQHAQYFILALKAYKDASRRDETMQAFVEALDDAAIEDLAYYYAATQPKRAQTPVAGDPFAGQAPAAACAGCHGEDGNNKDAKTPRLAGLDSAYLEAAIRAYKEGTRPHAAMRDSVAALKLADIRNVAAYYASREPKALPVRKPLMTSQWIARCERCHGPGGNSTDPRFPILAGQSEAYLIHELKQYHLKDRPSHAMFAMSFLMGESDIRKLAAYYARQGAKD